MKIKLYENLGSSIARLFAEAGHSATTAYEEGICSASDHEIIEVCRAEQKALVTLDNHFGNTLNFPPGKFNGIIVLRAGRDARLAEIIVVARTAIEGLSHRTK